MDLVGEDKDLKFRFGQIKELAKTKTSRNSAIVFSGNFLSSVLALVAVIFVSRALGPEKFGILAIYNSLIATILGLTDFGLGTAAIKLFSSNVVHNRHRAQVVLKVLFKIEIALGALIGITGLLFSTQIAQILGGQYLLLAVRLAFVSSIFSSAAAFIGPFFVSYEQFFKNSLIGLVAPVLKVAGIVLFVSLAILNLNNILFLYTAVAIIGFFVGLIFVPKDYLIKATKKEQKEIFNEIFHFSKWILLSYIATVIVSKLDIFLLSSTKGSIQVGLYAAAQQLASIMPILIGAIVTVLLPKASKMTKKVEFLGYIKKVGFASIFLAICLIPVLVFGGLIIGLVFGDKFAGSILSFQIIFAAYLFALVANPLGVIIYAINKPQIGTLFNFIQLSISVPLNLLLIPRFGAPGAAITFLIINIIGFALSVSYVVKAVDRMKA